MIFITAKKLHFVYYLSIGLLGLPLLTECNKIKLVGPSRCSGRLEVYNRDEWGTVCDDQWSITNADVVCRELNCGTVLEAKRAASFGEGKGMIWLDDVQCTGRESSVLKCPHRPFGDNNCGHGEDAGVVCSEHVRVLNGSNRCSGRVEVYNNGNWKRLCSSDWSKEDADVVCREMNCGTPVTQAEVQYFGEARELGSIKSNCFGNESSLSQCTLQESKESCVDAIVVCSNSQPIRVMNGTGRCSGRLEIYNDGQWGTICDDRWGMQEATVACRELNCGSALSVKYKSHFGRGHGQVWLDDLECTGHEKSLADCPHRGFGEHDCDHNEDASVVCSESVRLLNGTDRCSGRVEVFHDGQWGKMCNNWGNEEAAMVCQELSCGLPKKSQEIFHFGDSGLRGYTSRCSGNVSSISQCTLQEYTGICEGASLSCAGVPQLRLINGTDQCSGRVEIQHDGQWGTVCDDEWDIRDAQVVCRAMDCGTAQTAKGSAFFGEGQGDIWLDDVGCNGNETSLLHCRHPTLGENNCGHGEDAGVVCSAHMRLINGTDQCSGRVEFYHGGQWSSATDVNWGMNEAAVVCRQMNCGDPVKFSGSYGQGGQLKWYRVSCSGRESSLTQCTLVEYVRTSQDRIEEASVKCSGNVKLSDGLNRCVGRVEFFDKGQWGTVCGESWDVNDANVVCRQLGCERTHKITTIPEYGHGTGHTWINQIECNGMESTLSQCHQRPFRDKTCNTTSIAGVVCTGSLEVRLANGKDECSGRVEVRHGDVWQTVCDTDWTTGKAQVVCDRLECGNIVNAPGSAHFGQGIGSVVEASNSCFDNVTSLQQCSLKGFRGAGCGHDHDAAALCAAQTRCWRYLFRFSTEAPNHFESCSRVDFSKTGSYFCEYQKKLPNQVIYYPQGNTADLSVTVKLEKPSISLTSPHAMVIYSPDKISVTQGNSFSVTCSIHSIYPGGFFYLTESNSNTSEVIAAFGHSIFYLASFEFPLIDYKSQGEYYCVYGVNISSRSFCSVPSKSLQVTVVATSSSVTLEVVVGVLVVLLLVLVIGYLVWRRRRWGAGTMVQFSNRFGGEIKPDTEDMSNGALDGRGQNTQVNEHAHSRGPQDNKADVDDSVESVPEDLAGRVCYELEPLVLS
ncbi:hypothetical protein VZT92_011053 [Zoarces viviparus]|uniref:Soluble scavenger receptor cysteine-rich domain-containing protein SSC5D n=1 Tax=Zoarces viviparus TaxID=48416 RepID=A0AAW1FB84_ZOAVI